MLATYLLHIHTAKSTSYQAAPLLSLARRSRTNNLLFQILHNSRRTPFLIGQPTTPTNLTILASLRDLAFLNARLEGTATHVEFLGWACGCDVEVEDVHWESQGCAGAVMCLVWLEDWRGERRWGMGKVYVLGDVDDPSNVALDRGTREKKVDLVV